MRSPRGCLLLAWEGPSPAHHRVQLSHLAAMIADRRYNCNAHASRLPHAQPQCARL